MDFLPSVGPGYEDTAVRPWNRIHKKERKNGEYYAEYFQKAISLRPKVCLDSPRVYIGCPRVCVGFPRGYVPYTVGPSREGQQYPRVCLG